MPKQMTIENFHASGEKFIALTAYLPGGGHIEVEGAIRRVPSSGTSPANYWIGRMCLNHNAVMSRDEYAADFRHEWKIYSSDYGGAS